MQQEVIKYGDKSNDGTAHRKEILRIAMVLCEASQAKTAKTYTNESEFFKNIETDSPYDKAIRNPNIFTITAAMSKNMYRTTATATFTNDSVLFCATYAGLYIELLFDNFIYDSFVETYSHNMLKPNENTIQDLFRLSDSIVHGCITVSAFPVMRVIEYSSQAYLINKLSENPYFARAFYASKYDDAKPTILLLFMDYLGLNYIRFTLEKHLVPHFTEFGRSEIYLTKPTSTIARVIDNCPYH